MSFRSLCDAVEKLHKGYHVPHVVVTSVHFDASSSLLSVVGSTARADGSPRLFKIDVPKIDCAFVGTGDMFAALTVARLRQTVNDAGLQGKKSWVSPDDVEAIDLPLAKAAEKVLGSMQTILQKTKEARDEALAGMGGPLGALEKEKDSEKKMNLRRTKAAEVRVVRNLADLKETVVRFHAEPLTLKDIDRPGPVN